MRLLPGTAAVALGLAVGCQPTTSRLSPELEARFEQEGILHREENAVFRYTWNSGAGWENRDASILATSRTVYIHKNEKVGVEIVPGSRTHYEVRRDHDRVIIRVGSGRTADSWSFRPTSDAEGWAKDIRAVIGRTE